MGERREDMNFSTGAQMASEMCVCVCVWLHYIVGTRQRSPWGNGLINILNDHFFGKCKNVMGRFRCGFSVGDRKYSVYSIKTFTHMESPDKDNETACVCLYKKGSWLCLWSSVFVKDVCAHYWLLSRMIKAHLSVVWGLLPGL